MARIKNISPDTRSLFRPDAPPVFPGDEITVPDEVFVGLGWPSDTWEVIEPPAGDVTDASSEDVVLYIAAEVVPDPASTPESPVDEVPAEAAVEPVPSPAPKRATTTKAPAKSQEG